MFLLGLYILLAVFATAFHIHPTGNHPAVHDACGFCQMTQTGSLAGGDGHQALRSGSPSVPGSRSPVLPGPLLRPFLPYFFAHCRYRAPPAR